MLVHHNESFYSKTKCLKQPLYLLLNSNLSHVLWIKYSWFHTLETYYTTDAMSFKVSFKNFSFKKIRRYRKYKQINRFKYNKQRRADMFFKRVVALSSLDSSSRDILTIFYYRI